ncbi:hypothetical protein [Novosphingobium sp. Leaf2]|uniref:hypothetical protein n=1 Tax=Novosphingobium sp. Leaf2 TaxID=1735670 RepID=UPI0006F58F7D|nr:hypothetical protein [Novosphingobium sp. Leaf2]KQM21369.1 hypothetical protein ASE49_14920 [Novosphingobium sp. Leaf2]
MGGAIGATTGKFVLLGAALLLHGRVEDKAAHVAIVPGAPTSAMTQALAARIAAPRRKVDIHLRAETFAAAIAAVEPDVGSGADVRIGQDVLNTQPIEIDFAHHDVRPLSPDEAASFKARSHALTMQRGPGGSLTVAIAFASRPATLARLDLSRAVGIAAPDAVPGEPVKVGGVDLRDVAVTREPQAVVGLYAFKHTRVIFDLAQGRIWVHD